MKKDCFARLREGRDVVITVFGDFCLDKYLYVDAERDELSLETGLTAYQVTGKKLSPGAAGTITNNLRAMGAKVLCVGILGEDGEGYELERCLKKIGADTEYMVHTSVRATCTYTKPMRMEDGGEREMNRFDFRNFSPTPEEIEQRLLDALERASAVSDAVVISDQFCEENFAAVTKSVRAGIASLSERRDIPFYVDSRQFAGRFEGCIVKCNDREVLSVFGEEMAGEGADGLEQVSRCALRLYEKNKKPVVVTLGEMGCLVASGQIGRIPAYPAKGPLDIVGAGDAFNAGFIFALSKGLSLEEAADIGNAASNVSIRKIGETGSASLQEIWEVVR